jgi:cysteinyl-tRNA synthetase
VNYWFHTGHLNIKGLKMSKSLKNFVTIRDALDIYTSRQIRFCFLLHKYNSIMDYSDNTMTEAANIEKIFSEFFHNAKAILRRHTAGKGSQYMGSDESALLAQLEDVKTSVRASLLDDFDTPKATLALAELVKETNKYMELASSASFSSVALGTVARYITSVLRTFGLVQDPSSEIGFGSSQSAGTDLSAQLLDVLTKFRETVRVAAISGDTQAVLAIADELRDKVLPSLGVRMEDKGSGKDVVTVWKLEDKEVLRIEMAQKEAANAAKLKAKEDAIILKAAREKKARVRPQDLFTSLTELYSAFDSEGVPTHDKKGEPLSNAAIKKLQKEFAKQKDAYDKWSASNENANT